MRKENFYLLFYKKCRLLKSGEAAIYMRISCNGTRIECPTGKSIEPNLWSQNKEKAKGGSKKAIDLNNYIDDASIRLFKLFEEMQADGSVVTARELYNRFYNIGPHKKVERMLIATFQEHNAECRALMGRDFELGTIKKYETITRLLQRYIAKKYEAEDLPLTSLDRDFVHGFELYLKIDRNQQQNTVARYMKGLKKITNRALANEWITKNPFADFKVRTVQTNPTKTPPTILAAFVKEMRRKHHLTQTDLADKSGVGLNFVRNLEQGKPTLRLDKINQVLALFNAECGPVAITKTVES